MVDHNVVRFDVSVHDAFTVAKVQCFEQFEDIVSHIVINESRIERPEVGVVHIFEY